MTLHTQSSWNLETDLFLHTPFISPLCSLPVRFFFFSLDLYCHPFPPFSFQFASFLFLSSLPFSVSFPFPSIPFFCPSYRPHRMSSLSLPPCPALLSRPLQFSLHVPSFFPSLLPCHFLPVSSLSLPSHSRCPPIPIPPSFPAFPPISCLFPPSCPLSSPPSSFYSSPSSLSPFILSLQSPFPSSVHFFSLNG